jgi:hypothetical protein
MFASSSVTEATRFGILVFWICPTKQKFGISSSKRMHGFDFLVFYTEHVWIFGILDQKQFGILVFWYFAQKPGSGPLHACGCVGVEPRTNRLITLTSLARPTAPGKDGPEHSTQTKHQESHHTCCAVVVGPLPELHLWCTARLHHSTL